MLLILAAAAAAASFPAELPRQDERWVSREDAAPPAPVLPRGTDTRGAAPEVELALLDAKVGPVLRIGAFGGKHKAAPKLAHVSVGWRF